MNPYQKLLERKRTWTPVATNAGKFTEGAEEALLRALSLRRLELPVGDFIDNALRSEVPELSRNLLRSNVTDEEKHDLALDYIASAHGYTAKFDKEAEALTKAWVSHHDYPIVKALVLERSIFFVLLPFFRATGDAGLRTVSADISRDEQIHVATNSLVCREMGYEPSPSLDKLRKATVHWIFEPLGEKDAKFLSKNFWTNSSDRLMYEGKAPEFNFTRAARMPAFFEHSNVNLPQYA